ncbi:MAG: hypothetical protein Q8R30_04995 [bacterium]|nr:hypothetical protein [bacterium]MDZ4285491.1 hypothetical protein [Candidatus Sungbacteria bacterium]
MISAEFINAIKIVEERMKGAHMNWAVIASSNLALQGMDVAPNDLDVVVRRDDLHKISDLFHDFNASDVGELLTLNGKPAWDVAMKVGQVAVQFLGEHDSGPYVEKLLKQRIKNCPVDGYGVPCLTLDAEVEAYSQTGRWKKAKMVSEFLQAKK